MSVRFLLDENMPFAMPEFLRNRGYEAEHLKKLEKVGIKNGEVYKFAGMKRRCRSSIGLSASWNRKLMLICKKWGLYEISKK
ncbi:MAG: hypothetical protein GY749_49215 [Desulfobacteraceae bacterium]|nr:hypothetical protein [Desulfobacteraceae bacterium]